MHGQLGNNGKLASSKEKAINEVEKEVKSRYYNEASFIPEVTSKILYVYDNGDNLYDFIVGVQIIGGTPQSGDKYVQVTPDIYEKNNPIILFHARGFGNMGTVSVLSQSGELLNIVSLDVLPQKYINQAKVMWEID